MDTPQNEKKTSVQDSQDYSTRIFLFALELIPYFGIPAIIGVYLNKQLSQAYPDVGWGITAAVFITMYVCSWIIVIMRYRSIKRKHQK